MLRIAEFIASTPCTPRSYWRASFIFFSNWSSSFNFFTFLLYIDAPFNGIGASYCYSDISDFISVNTIGGYHLVIFLIYLITTYMQCYLHLPPRPITHGAMSKFLMGKLKKGRYNGSDLDAPKEMLFWPRGKNFLLVLEESCCFGHMKGM